MLALYSINGRHILLCDTQACPSQLRACIGKIENKKTIDGQLSVQLWQSGPDNPPIAHQLSAPNSEHLADQPRTLQSNHTMRDTVEHGALGLSHGRFAPSAYVRESMAAIRNRCGDVIDANTPHPCNNKHRKWSSARQRQSRVLMAAHTVRADPRSTLVDGLQMWLWLWLSVQCQVKTASCALHR